MCTKNPFNFAQDRFAFLIGKSFLQMLRKRQQRRSHVGW